MSLIWKFTLDKEPQTCEWLPSGAMRCTSEQVIADIDSLISDGAKLRCGSATLMVDPTLETEAGAYAVISEAVFMNADFLSIQYPQCEATVTSDVVLFDDEEIEKASFNGNRSAAGAYAARVRWGNTFDPLAVKETGGHALEQQIDAAYPHKEDEDFPFTSSQSAAVLDYTEEGWSINNELRAKGAGDPEATSEHSRTIEKMDSAFDSAEPLADAVVLHRGLGVDNTPAAQPTIDFFSQLKVGQSFMDPAYISTSTHDKISTEYAANSKIRFKIVVPAGKKVLPINTVLGKKNHYFGEHEVLLPRGSKFKVVEVVNETWDTKLGVGRTIKVVLQ